MRSYGEDPSDQEATRVTRSIMIVRPPGYQNGSPPVSPAGSTPPVSPFFGKRSKCQKCPCIFTWIYILDLHYPGAVAVDSRMFTRFFCHYVKVSTFKWIIV